VVHRAVNERFVSDLLAVLGPDALGPQEEVINVLDVGAGTALIPIELSRRLDRVRVTAIDLSQWMLRLARKNVASAGSSDRIHLQEIDAKAMPFGVGSFDLAVSNSIVHHVAEPLAVLKEMVRVTVPGGVLFVRDLLRPPDEPTVARLVGAYAGDANAHQRALFEASLRAALTVKEMRGLVAEVGFPEGGVEQTSDRHWTWVCTPGL